MASPKRDRGGRRPQITTPAPQTATPSPTATTPPATTTATATAATTGVAATVATPTPPQPTPATNGNGTKIARLHIGPTGPWHDENGNSCLIWTPRGYNAEDDAVKTDIHLVADRPFFLYKIGQPCPAAARQSYNIRVKEAQATSYMIVVTTRGSMEIDVTVPSRRLSIENIRMPGAMRQSIALEGILYGIAIALGLYLFRWRFAMISGSVGAAVAVAAIVIGCGRAIRHRQRHFISDAFRWTFASDNRLWLVWILMCLVATGVAVTHPGEGLVAPAVYEANQNPDSIAQEERMQKFRNLSSGREFKSDRELDKPTPKQLPPRAWTWFWVNAYFWMWGWTIMIPTFADDVMAMSSRVWQKMWRSLGGEASLVNAWPTFLTALRGRKISVPARPSAEQTASATAGEIGSSVFWHSLSANLITELPSILHAFFKR
ncbi:MAG: Extracellular solute-binding protein, family 1 [Parcubacteria group bacterium GW2011_GWA2_46_9]|nr:MAG: Extracellular solute-binding protein, family 1 [Parcubacteria group bacterium GW2011_GWA2_46_9]